MKPTVYFDNQTLQDFVKEPNALRHYIGQLNEQLDECTSPVSKVRVLGELGVLLRILGELDEAEQNLLLALKLITDHELGVRLVIQQEIRLAHVYQWKKLFKTSDVMFENIVQRCRNEDDGSDYLDFALQHAGKNLFDQARYKEALILFNEALSSAIQKNPHPI